MQGIFWHTSKRVCLLFGNLTHWPEYPPYKRVVGGSIPSVSTTPFLTDSDTLGVPPTRKGGLFGSIVQSGRSVAC